MLTVEEALSRIISQVHPLNVVELDFVHCPTAALFSPSGLVIAEAVIAQTPVPAFANSAMDGYAVRSGDVAGASDSAHARLRDIGESAAGVPFIGQLNEGKAVRIYTGAMLPDGADAVVMQEVTSRDGEFVLIRESALTGAFVREIGNDVAAGEVVLPAGTPLTPAAIGMLAALGQSTVRVLRRPRVGILSTGDELVAPGGPLDPGQIHDANRYALQAQVTAAGAEVVAVAYARDTRKSLVAALDSLAGCDVIVSSGGVSVGDHDLVKTTIGDEGSVDFWRVAVRPGKPLAFGTLRGIPFFGLPGNPVSSYVTFELFVRPALRRMLGHAVVSRPIVSALLKSPVTHAAGRRSYIRSVVSAGALGFEVEPLAKQDSAVMSAMAQANALIVIPESAAGFEAGETVNVVWLSGE